MTKSSWDYFYFIKKKDKTGHIDCATKKAKEEFGADGQLQTKTFSPTFDRVSDQLICNTTAVTRDMLPKSTETYGAD